MRDFALQIVSLVGMLVLMQQMWAGASVFETLIVGSVACLTAFGLLRLVDRVQQRARKNRLAAEPVATS